MDCAASEFYNNKTGNYELKGEGKPSLHKSSLITKNPS